MAKIKVQGKRIASFLLVFMMLFSLVPFAVFADGSKDYTVEEKTADIMEYMERKRICVFEDLFASIRSRGEAVALFMALLELVRDGFIDVERNGEDIELSFAEGNENAERMARIDEYQ